MQMMQQHNSTAVTSCSVHVRTNKSLPYRTEYASQQASTWAYTVYDCAVASVQVQCYSMAVCLLLLITQLSCVSGLPRICMCPAPCLSLRSLTQWLCCCHATQLAVVYTAQVPFKYDGPSPWRRQPWTGSSEQQMFLEGLVNGVDIYTGK